jgi:hypothetical protein
MKVRDDEYNWLLDIPRILIEYLVVMIISPFFVFPSFFLNNQEVWVATMYRFLYLKYFRLSGYAA